MITEIGYLFATQPKAAKDALLKLIEEHDGDAPRIAVAAGVSRKQVDRWLIRAGLLERAAKIRAKVKGK